MRRLSSLLLSLEHPHPTVDAMVAKFARVGERAGRRGPGGQRAADRRRRRRSPAGLSQPRDRHRRLQPVLSRVPVRSPRCRESRRPSQLPAGLRGAAGIGARRLSRRLLRLRASSITIASRAFPARRGRCVVTFRRPTPRADRTAASTSLGSQVDRGIASTARLLLDDEVLCTGEVNTLASPPEKLTGFQFGRRRKESAT